MIRADALTITATDLQEPATLREPTAPEGLPGGSIHPSGGSLRPGPENGLPTALVANLPYNVSVPVVLHLLSPAGIAALVSRPPVAATSAR